jgi:hypothetical protein
LTTVREADRPKVSEGRLGVASVENIASCRVLEKTGFTYEREAIDLGETVAVYRLTR